MRLPVPIDTAVLLAAGRGERLAPWTERTPEALLVHRGRATLDLVLDALARAGIVRVVLVVHHLAEQFEPYVAQRRAINGQHIVCVRQDRLFGTAHALQCVMYARPELLAIPFLLSAARYRTPPDFYADLLRFHTRHDAPLSISLGRRDDAPGRAMPSGLRLASAADATAPIASDAASDAVSGAVTESAPETHDIIEIVDSCGTTGQPDAIGANLCFVLPPEVLVHVEETPASARGERRLQSALNTWLAAGGRARGLLQPTLPEWAPPEGRTPEGRPPVGRPPVGQPLDT